MFGILAAFWIDAWWEARQERAVEREYLDALLVEIDEVLAEVDRTLRENTSLNELGRNRALSWSNGVQPAGEDLQSLVDDTWVSFRLRAGLDTYADLLSSGAVTIIRNSQLRSQLAKLKTTMDFEQEVFTMVIDQGMLMRPLLLQSIQNNDLAIVSRIESDIVATREVHNDRKREVRVLAATVRELIVAELARES